MFSPYWGAWSVLLNYQIVSIFVSFDNGGDKDNPTIIINLKICLGLWQTFISMEKLIYSLGILALSACMFSSCGDDEDESQNQNNSVSYSYFTADQKRLVETKVSSENVSSFFEYDSFGRVTKMTHGENVRVYHYNGSSYSIEYLNDDGVKVEGTLNSKGFVASEVQVVDTSTFDFKYSYDSDGHPIASYTYPAYEWKDGNLVSLSLSTFQNVFQYTNDEVTSPIENKALIPFYYGSVLQLDVEIATRSIYGVGSKYLPVSMSNADGVIEAYFNWTLDEDGYPIKLDVTNLIDSEYNNSMTLVWK